MADRLADRNQRQRPPHSGSISRMLVLVADPLDLDDQDEVVGRVDEESD